MNLQHYAEIKRGLTSWNAFVREQRAKNFAWGGDLRDAYLRGGDLRGGDLREADLREADLREADLREADLREADLLGANFRDADLRGTKFSDVPIRPEDLLEQIAVAIRKPGALDMYDWHTCETTHCLGGWAAYLTPGGVEFARKTSDHLAGVLLAPELAHLFYKDHVTALRETEKYLPEGYTAPEEAAE